MSIDGKGRAVGSKQDDPKATEEGVPILFTVLCCGVNVSLMSYF